MFVLFFTVRWTQWSDVSRPDAETWESVWPAPESPHLSSRSCRVLCHRWYAIQSNRKSCGPWLESPGCHWWGSGGHLVCSEKARVLDGRVCHVWNNVNILPVSHWTSLFFNLTLSLPIPFSHLPWEVPCVLFILPQSLSFTSFFSLF